MNTLGSRTLRRLPVLALAAALLLLISPASVLRAQPPGGPGAMGAGDGPGGPGGPGFLLRRVARALDLSDAQVEQSKALLETFASTVQPLREQAQTLRGEIEDLLAADTPDAAAIGQRVIEGHSLREQMRAAWDDFETAFEALLTPAQKERWELLKDVRAFLGPRHGGPRGGGMGPGGQGGPGA